MKRLYPIKFYNERIGKKLYRSARKLGLSKSLSLHAAHVPGSMIHAFPAIALGNPYLGLSLMVISHCIFPTIMEQEHEDNEVQRNSSLEEMCEKTDYSILKPQY